MNKDELAESCVLSLIHDAGSDFIVTLVTCTYCKYCIFVTSVTGINYVHV